MRPSCGKTALGDVHVRHHFHARNDRQREMPRRRRHFVKRAIDAVTNFEFVFERLEMDVARAVLNRLKQDQIDKANDRRGVRFRFDVRSHSSSPRSVHQLARFAELLEDILHAGGVGAVVAFDPIFDLFGRRDDDVDVFAEREAEIFRRAQIERIDQRDPQSVVGKADRQRAMQAGPGPLGINRQNSGGISRSVRSTNSVAERIGDRLIKSGFIDEAAVDHRLRDGLAVQVRFLQNVIRLRWLQDVLFDKKIGDSVCCSCQSSFDVSERDRNDFLG